MILVPGCAEDVVETSPPALPRIPTDGLLAFYPFNGSAQDASGNDNHGSLSGTASVSTYLTIPSDAVARASLPETLIDNLGDFTISVWARIATLHVPGDHTILSGAQASQKTMLLLKYNPESNNWALAVDGDAAQFGPTATIQDLSWHHVVALRNATIARLYFDGVEIGDGSTISGAATAADREGLVLGQHQDSVGGGFDWRRSWAGDLDNLRIYDRALTSSDIQALYKETGWGE